MRIATLQFSPKLGEVEANIKAADLLLTFAEEEGRLEGLDILILPEMAFSGYNFSSLTEIWPLLELTANGVSTQWAVRTAKRLNCIVAVGYPELSHLSKSAASMTATEGAGPDVTSDDSAATPYNSLVFVDPQGEVIAHHRKAFLYYTDEYWAQEGPGGFYHGSMPLGIGGENVGVAAGICMDINPYKFQAPYSAYEFANHCRKAMAKVVIVSMAWLTRHSHIEMYGTKGDASEMIRNVPDMDTITYWIGRFEPLLDIEGSEDEVIVIFANRAGEEGEAPLIGEVRYAGSSSVMGMSRADQAGETNVRIWDMMGRGVDGLLVVDTEQPPRYSVRNRSPDRSEHETTTQAADSVV